jgi:hypothetical protein
MSGIQQAVISTFIATGLKPGDAYEGGFYAGQISTAGNGIADYNLVVAPRSSGQTDAVWKTSRTLTAGTDSVIDGPTNSANMNNASHPGAQFCEALTIGGFSDWYLPAANELEVCYYNLKPTTDANFTFQSGVNLNAVPSRGSTYTSGTPAQTSAAAFQSPSGAEFYQISQYWSSTQGFTYTQNTGRAQYFNNAPGRQIDRDKITSHGVRAVRRVAV